LASRSQLRRKFRNDIPPPRPNICYLPRLIIRANADIITQSPPPVLID